jgi:hypothetical protein
LTEEEYDDALDIAAATVRAGFEGLLGNLPYGKSPEEAIIDVVACLPEESVAFQVLAAWHTSHVAVEEIVKSGLADGAPSK